MHVFLFFQVHAPNARDAAVTLSSKLLLWSSALAPAAHAWRPAEGNPPPKIWRRFGFHTAPPGCAQSHAWWPAASRGAASHLAEKAGATGGVQAAVGRALTKPRAEKEYEEPEEPDQARFEGRYSGCHWHGFSINTKRLLYLTLACSQCAVEASRIGCRCSM